MTEQIMIERASDRFFSTSSNKKRKNSERKTYNNLPSQSLQSSFYGGKNWGWQENNQDQNGNQISTIKDEFMRKTFFKDKYLDYMPQQNNVFLKIETKVKNNLRNTGRVKLNSIDLADRRDGSVTNESQNGVIYDKKLGRDMCLFIGSKELFVPKKHKLIVSLNPSPKNRFKLREGRRSLKPIQNYEDEAIPIPKLDNFDSRKSNDKNNSETVSLLKVNRPTVVFTEKVTSVKKTRHNQSLKIDVNNFNNQTALIDQISTETFQTPQKQSQLHKYEEEIEGQYKKIAFSDFRVQTHIKMTFLAPKFSQKSNWSPTGSDFKLTQIQRKFIKRYLELRFTKLYTDRILDFFEFNQVVTINELFEKFNILIQGGRDEIMKFCFQIFDLNQDGIICMKDLSDNLNNFYDQDYYLQRDINNFVKHIFKNPSERRTLSNVKRGYPTASVFNQFNKLKKCGKRFINHKESQNKRHRVLKCYLKQQHPLNSKVIRSQQKFPKHKFQFCWKYSYVQD
ncbi:UNKNOWN [Stylonychia lemnae]|uniref:EF-hand domain-containing protein n=1 Tax=Stylonychia lemnae TaxID=5949 RepID=A0A078B1G5_STYLE|nr:UNKNOWN [Stylonychia lemnae]|eukprot:CDW87068.1 UNKNOWN [Stylonychia lemnae]